MSLNLVSLASGSKGNCTLIFSDTTALLVDAGVSYTRISREMKEFGMTPDMLDGVLLTHEHHDHISGVPRLMQHTAVYAHPLTAKAVYDRTGALKNYRETEYYENGFTIGDIEVMPFRIPHDAAYPLAYSFKCGDARVSVATDIGQPTRGLMRNIRDSEVVLLEANHDVDMLKSGSYPYLLKQRILGTNGHLSNAAAARVAVLLGQTSVKKILLGHISENNNLPSLALGTVQNAVNEAGCGIELYCASQDAKSEVFTVK